MWIFKLCATLFINVGLSHDNIEWYDNGATMMITRRQSGRVVERFYKNVKHNEN